MKKHIILLQLLFISMITFGQGLLFSYNNYVSVLNGAKIIINNSNLKMQATAVGSSSLLVDNNSNSGISVNNGQTIVQSYIVADKWHLISSALNNATVTTFNNMWVRPYIENTNVWGSYITNGSSILSPGKGYSLYTFSTGTPSTGSIAVSYSSSNTTALNNGSISPAITYSGTGKGFNLIGNPYPCAIDWNIDNGQGWTRTNMANSIYIWNQTAEQYGTYTKGEVSGTHDVTNIINMGQGFFIEANANSPIISMDNRVRLHNTGNKAIFKSLPIYLKLKIEELSQSKVDELLVSFRTEGNNTTLTDFDATKMFSSLPEVPSIYTVKEGKMLTLNAMKTYADDLIIPVGFIPGNAGMAYKAYIPSNNISGLGDVYIKDLKTNDIFKISDGSAYYFTSSANDINDRFQLLFKLTNNINENENPIINMYAFEKNLIIHNHSDNIINGSFSLYNVMGQSLLLKNVDLQSKITTISLQIAKGVYIAEFVVLNKKYIKKIVIN